MPMCSLCQDVGILRYDVEVDDPRFGKTYNCACQQPKIAQRIQTAIGTKLDSQKFIKDIQLRGEGSRAMVAAGKKFIENPFGFLTIYGLVLPADKRSSANGNGKTTCLQALVNECVQRGTAAVYMTASDLIEFLKDGIGNDGYDVEDRLNVLCTIPILSIDEMSQPAWTPWVEDKLSTLINRRYANELGTVLALDDDPATFLHRRIYSRLLEGVLVRNSDPDMRPVLGGAHE
jgi:chromosomal replication initiation ATPase DnaA